MESEMNKVLNTKKSQNLEYYLLKTPQQAEKTGPVTSKQRFNDKEKKRIRGTKPNYNFGKEYELKLLQDSFNTELRASNEDQTQK